MKKQYLLNLKEQLIIEEHLGKELDYDCSQPIDSPFIVYIDDTQKTEIEKLTGGYLERVTKKVNTRYD